MLKKLNQHISNKFPFLKEKNLLIACSGGIDSVVLTRLLKELNFKISIAHCNFTLRGKESDGDKEFVIKLADKLSIPIFTKTFQTKKYASENKISTQMAARDLRYEWFDELLQEHSFDYLLTAHHLGDDLETFFINLSRGTGLRGLTGIPIINEKIVRPFLEFSREEILQFANDRDIKWREDSSNASTDYLRNKLRLEVLPNYTNLNNNVLQNFQQTQKHLNESLLLVEDYMLLIQNLILNKTTGGVEIDINQLQELPNTKALLYELLSPYGFTAWDDILDLLKAQSGKHIFSGTHQLLKNRNSLLLSKITSENSSENIFISKEMIEIVNPINLKFEKVSSISENNKNVVFVDFQKIKFPLEIRNWKEGDYFYPFGMKGKKKLSKFFKDEKLSLIAKENIRVLCSENVIVWVLGMRPDNRFKVTDKTKEILKITYN
ncbi:MAG: tRNA lysidine(34) synthetase TilS [Flavobacteriaceae bacterium]